MASIFLIEWNNMIHIVNITHVPFTCNSLDAIVLPIDKVPHIMKRNKLIRRKLRMGEPNIVNPRRINKFDITINGAKIYFEVAIKYNDVDSPVPYTNINIFRVSCDNIAEYNAIASAFIGGAEPPTPSVYTTEYRCNREVTIHDNN